MCRLYYGFLALQLVTTTNTLLPKLVHQKAVGNNQHPTYRKR
jgi:hypothetical protein